jgi:hypothetical protein
VVFVCRKRPEFAGFVLNGGCADCAVPVAIVMSLNSLQILCKVRSRTWIELDMLLQVVGRLAELASLAGDGKSALDKLTLSDKSYLPPTSAYLGGRSNNYALSDRTGRFPASPKHRHLILPPSFAQPSLYQPSCLTSSRGWTSNLPNATCTLMLPLILC